MIQPYIRKSIRELHASGKGRNELARMFSIDPKTVTAILNEPEGHIPVERSDKKTIDVELLQRLYGECHGFISRMHEKLTEEYQIDLGYSTLTQLVRENGIGKPLPPVSESIPDIPGDEMQHDTTIYQVMIGGTRKKVVCSGLYFRYSKMRYIKFYLRFDRFKMKCFIHEALLFFGYCATWCIIDNTNLAVYSGTGSNAVIHPEMVSFAARYGFKWKAHRLNHPNRKAGIERTFYTTETNFLPGRTFPSLADLNQQAKHWATERLAKKRITRHRIIPRALFEAEKPSLIQVGPEIVPPTKEYERLVDQYGYVAMDGNFYWVPPRKEGPLCE